MSSFNPLANKPYGEVQVSVDDQEISPQARERLEYASDGGGIETVLEFLDGDRKSIEAETIVRSLALLGGELCLEVAHEDSTEYIWLTEEWDGLVSGQVSQGPKQRNPRGIGPKGLQHRIDDGKPIAVRLTEDIPLAGSEVPA